MKGHTGIINYISFSPNAPILASCSTDMTIKLWNLQTFTNYKTLQGHDHEVSAVEFLPNGDFLVSCSRDTTIKLWDLATSICVHTVKGHSDWVKHLSVNGSGSLVASSSKDQTVMVWNIEKIKAKSQDPVVQILSGHDNFIDVVVFANFDACKVIDKAEYNKDFASIAAELVSEE
jgi:platelet-activating factor acetylhydrolase IB subunit alpha